MEFAIRLVNSVLNLPNGQVMFFEEFKLKKNCEINSARQKTFGASLKLIIIIIETYLYRIAASVLRKNCYQCRSCKKLQIKN